MSDREWERVQRAADEWLPTSAVEDALEHGTRRGAGLLTRKVWSMWVAATIAVVGVAVLAFGARTAIAMSQCPGYPDCAPVAPSESPSLESTPQPGVSTASSQPPEPSAPAASSAAPATSAPPEPSVAPATSAAPASQEPPVTPPTVRELSPGSGPQDGGTEVTVVGSGFTDPATVQVGGMDPVPAKVASPTELVFVTPALTGDVPAGVPLDVIVTTGVGSSGVLDQATFTYLLRPVVDSVEPAEGPASGGEKVQISGSGLAEASVVTFGGLEAELATRPTDTVIVVIAPPLDDPARADTPLAVQVTAPGGQSEPMEGVTYTYRLPAPVVTGLTPDHGPQTGGTTVTITGTALSSITDVAFGPVSVPVASASDTQVVVVTPPTPKSIVVNTPVTVTVSSSTTGRSAGSPTPFTYDGPIIE